jgi:hypothetical protein
MENLDDGNPTGAPKTMSQYTDEQYFARWGETKEQSIALYPQRRAEDRARNAANDQGFFKTIFTNPITLGILAAILLPGIGTLISNLGGLAAEGVAATAAELAAATGLSAEAATVAATAAASGADLAAITALAAPIEQLVVTGALASGGTAFTATQIAAATAAAITAAATSGATTIPASDVIQNLPNTTAEIAAAPETIPSLTTIGQLPTIGLSAEQIAAASAIAATAATAGGTGGATVNGPTATTSTGEVIPSLEVAKAAPTSGLLTGTLGGASAAALANSLYPTADTAPVTSLEVLGPKPTGIVPTIAGASAAALANSLYPGNNQVTVTGQTPTSGLTAGTLAALGLAGTGALSLNNTGPTGQSTDTTTGGGLTDLITKYGPAVSGLLGGGLSTANAYNAADAAQTIYNTEAGTLGTAAKAAAPGYQFSPIGMTTAFGNATPKFDANGKLIGYDYAATPGVAAQRDQLMKLSQQALPSTTDPTAIMNNYIKQQQGLLAPGQAQDLATLQAQMAATGRSGLGTGATAGTAFSPALAATNPQLAAYYNSLAQQNQQISANAPTYAQNLLNAQIGTSGTLFGQAKDMETAAQQPLLMGQQLGTQITAGTTAASNASYKAAQDAASLVAQGAGNALYAKTEANKALINQLSGSSTSGTSGLIGSLLGTAGSALASTFLGGGTTVVGGTGTGATNTAGAATTGATTGATTAGTATLPTKLLSGGTTVVGGTGTGGTTTGTVLPPPNLTVNNASNTLPSGGGLITGSNATASPATAANTFVNNGGSATFGTNGALVSAVPQYDAAGKLIGYNYGNTATAPTTNTGLLTGNTGNTITLAPATGGLLTGNTATTAAKPTTVADVLAAYKNNPQANAANPNGPDQAALAYWLQNGLGGFNQAVTSVAAQPLSIEDEIRRAYNNNPQAKALNPNGPDAAAIAYWKQQGLGNFNQVVSDVFAQSLASR